MVFNPDQPEEHRKKRSEQPSQAPLIPSPNLSWLRVDRWHIRSECGYYTVSKAHVLSSPIYSAWHRPNAKGTDIPRLLGTVDSASEAKAICSQHHQLQLMGS